MHPGNGDPPVASPEEPLSSAVSFEGEVEPVIIDTGDVVHRGYRDASGTFTLEGDNLDQAADSVVYAGRAVTTDLGRLCRRCWVGYTE